jgi:serine/threonine protein kinase
MSDSLRQDSEALETMVADESVAKAFNGAIAAGDEPDLPALASQFNPERQALVAAQLIALDTLWRRTSGRSERTSAEYLALFPEHTDVIRLVVSESTGTADLTGASDDPQRTLSVDETREGPSTTKSGTTKSGSGISRPGTSGSTTSSGIELVGQYELLEKIGGGGMGVVYKARQRGVDRIVALKLIKNSAHSSQERERFLREAQAAGKLDHPHIVPVHDFGEFEGSPYMAMSFVDGGSLKGVLQKGLPDPAEVTLWMADVAEAIAHAHERGVIHRDLKPDNILLGTDGRVRVTDFGLARLTEGDHDLTSEGQLLGTAGYMAPEQARGRKLEIGPHTDVYGLGATLYALLAGQPPFRASRLLDTLNLIVNDKPNPPSQLNRSVSAELDAVCLKCLEKSPSARYASAQALADALRALARRPSAEPVTSTKQRSVTGPFAMAGIVAVAVAGIALVGWITREQWRPRSSDRDLSARNGATSASLPTAPPAPTPLATNPALVEQSANPPAVAPPSTSSPSTSAEESVVADNNPSLPAKVTAFRIERYRDTADQSQLMGEIGGDLQHADVDDAVRVSVDFDQPVHAFLVALNPDGTSQLCWPADPETVPPAVKSIRYPTDPQSAFYLTEGAGQQAFAVVVSHKPIPAFAKWPSRFGWAKTPPQTFVQAAATTEESEVVRGTERRLKGAVALEELCKNLRTMTDADRVEAIGFPVQPKP